MPLPLKSLRILQHCIMPAKNSPCSLKAQSLPLLVSFNRKYLVHTLKCWKEATEDYDCAIKRDPLCLCCSAHNLISVALQSTNYIIFSGEKKIRISHLIQFGGLLGILDLAIPCLDTV